MGVAYLRIQNRLKPAQNAAFEILYSLHMRVVYGDRTSDRIFGI